MLGVVSGLNTVEIACLTEKQGIVAWLVGAYLLCVREPNEVSKDICNFEYLYYSVGRQEKLSLVLTL